MEDLQAQFERLAARVTALEGENSALRAAQSEVRSTPAQRAAEAEEGSPRTGSGPLGRRGLFGKALGVAAVGAIGTTLLDQSPAAAATGDTFVLGSTSNAAANYSQLTCSDNNSALYVVSKGSSNIGYTAAVLGDTDTFNGIAGITSADPAVGVYGVSGAHSGMGYAPAAVFGDSLKYPGVYGESAQNHGVAGHTSATNSAGVYAKGPWIGMRAESNYIGVFAEANGPYGVIGVGKMTANAAGVSGQVGSDGTGNLGAVNTAGVVGLNTASDGQGYGVQGTHEGSGIGVYGTTWSAKGTGVRGQATTGVRGTGGTAAGGVGVLAEGNVAVKATGVGVGIVASVSNGRGGVFHGNVAQLQLAPGLGLTHPKAGQRGDLYVDKTGRLWFCKVSGSTATWKQVA